MGEEARPIRWMEGEEKVLPGLAILVAVVLGWRGVEGAMWEAEAVVPPGWVGGRESEEFDTRLLR